MKSTVLWLLAALGWACITSVTEAEPLKLMSAPNLLRVGTAENIYVECQDCAGQPPMDVRISAWNHPTKSIELKQISVPLNAGNKFQGLGELVIPPDNFNKDPSVKQYVYLVASFPGHTFEKVVLVTFQSGYLFIQTDKTLYTPEHTVNFRIFALTPGMKLIGRDFNKPASIEVEIVTPEGIVIPMDTVSLKAGLHSGTYQLGEIVSIGQWKVVSRFQSNPQQSYSAEFEVKKYVLPSFEVKLTTESSFYYYDSESFNVKVQATYLFGKEVSGMAYVVFGVMRDKDRKVFPASLQRIDITEGVGHARLLKEHITKTFPQLQDLVGGSLFVTAMVHTDSGSEMVEGELRNMQIVTSPYFINFDKTPKYFKAGMSFDVTVTVLNPDGTPAEGVPVVVEPGENVHGTTRANGRTTLSVNTQASDKSLIITARTNDPKFPADKQTSKSMRAVYHQSKNQNYIHIHMLTADVKLGADLNVHLNLNRQQGQFDISYLILSRGQLVDFGKQVANGQVTLALNIPVTKKMLPSFRLIVFYHPTPNEVVSDSVWVDVDDSCMGPLKLEAKHPFPSYEPRKTFHIKVTGEPGSTVGLVAVDKGVYVLNKKHILTQKKVWEIVEKADTGCTPGGGPNSLGVFFDAGLMFETHTTVGTPIRQESKCSPPANRKKRAGTLLDAITTLASRYKDPLEHECCKDGMKSTQLSYTCEQRKLYITDGKACEDAFLFCCEELARQRSDLKKNTLLLARSEDNNDFMDSSEITSRTNFPESWEWNLIKIPQCDGNPQCKDNVFEKGIPLKDSITTWVFTGISISENNGICVGKPLNVVVFKQFFIDLRLPYSAVVGEQIEIRAILHNYSPDEIIVRVELFENPDICSVASKRGSYPQTLTVGASGTRPVSFVIIPMKEGKLNIEVKAVIKESWSGDGVIKPLYVVPKGVLTKVKKDVHLEPRGGVQEQTINNAISPTEMVPETPSSTKVFLTGREQIGSLVEDVVGASSMGHLIYQPTGCGEQNMYHMTKPVIATTYLDKTNKWEEVGLEKRSEALNHIRTGITNEMKYAKPDGSFAVWAHEKSSTWLTTYVVKVFAMANNLVAVDNKRICDAVKYLTVKAQLPDGVFEEHGPIYHREYTGDVLGSESDATMTAFCLIALQESRRICNPLVNSLPDAIHKSVTYLRTRLDSLTNPYAVAITSYALANENQLNKDFLYRFATDMSHWRSPRGHVYSLEATGYALLALVKRGFLEDARPIVRWLSAQRQDGGGYQSTQATIIVYQAMAEYWAAAKEPDYKLDVKLTVPGRNAPYNFQFTRANHHTTRTSKNFDIKENVKVTANGTGEATLTLVTQYYAVPKETVSDCQKFNLSLDFTLDTVDAENGDIYKLKINYYFKHKTEDASMSILDVSMPTGFIHMNEDLNALAEGRAPIISQWEYNKELSERGSIILYTKKVSHDRIEEVAFRMRQTHKVGVLQPATVSIYEYYDATKCVRYYHPQKKDGRILRRCKDGVCLCAEENCSLQKKGNIKDKDRIAKSCEATLTSSIDYVYQTVLEGINYDRSIDTYTMRIDTIIKDGSRDKNVQGQLRKFISFSHCRNGLNLIKGRGYLIMGAAGDTLKDTNSDTYEYLIGERTWIEFWPRGAECQEPENRPTCLGIEALVDRYDNSDGCVAK